MPARPMPRTGLVAKLAAAALLVLLAEIAIDGSVPGAVLGAFALAWLAALAILRPAIARTRGGRAALLAAGGFALLLVDDPSLLAWALFWTALSIAALLPRHRFDDAFGWARRLLLHALFGLAAPVRDAAAAAAIRMRRGRGGALRRTGAMLILPVIGGATFLALFATANPLIAQVIGAIALPDPWTLTWRTMLGIVVLAMTWAALRPSAHATAARLVERRHTPHADLSVATLVLSLVTFNAIFAVENALDIAFLWSGAPLPGHVTMADYAHRGAYSLIVTALLAGALVLVALRPGSPAAASRAVRRLVMLWLAQNVLLVASSGLRTLDYVDAYGMTRLRLAALGWMALVAVGLALIGWRLLRSRSAAWLVNANALAATAALALAATVDLGSVAAAWNVGVALSDRPGKPPLDLCYIGFAETSAMVSLARLERRIADPELRDRVAFLRWQAQRVTAERQRAWRSWTWRDARRLATVEAIAGTRAPTLRAEDRECGRVVLPTPARAG